MFTRSSRADYSVRPKTHDHFDRVSFELLRESMDPATSSTALTTVSSGTKLTQALEMYQPGSLEYSALRLAGVILPSLDNSPRSSSVRLTAEAYKGNAEHVEDVTLWHTHKRPRYTVSDEPTEFFVGSYTQDKKMRQINPQRGGIFTADRLQVVEHGYEIHRQPPAINDNRLLIGIFIDFIDSPIN